MQFDYKEPRSSVAKAHGGRPVCVCVCPGVYLNVPHHCLSENDKGMHMNAAPGSVVLSSVVCVCVCVGVFAKLHVYYFYFIRRHRRQKRYNECKQLLFPA